MRSVSLTLFRGVFGEVADSELFQQFRSGEHADKPLNGYGPRRLRHTQLKLGVNEIYETTAKPGVASPEAERVPRSKNFDEQRKPRKTKSRKLVRHATSHNRSRGSDPAGARAIGASGAPPCV